MAFSLRHNSSQHRPKILRHPLELRVRQPLVSAHPSDVDQRVSVDDPWQRGKEEPVEDGEHGSTDGHADAQRENHCGNVCGTATKLSECEPDTQHPSLLRGGSGTS